LPQPGQPLFDRGGRLRFALSIIYLPRLLTGDALRPGRKVDLAQGQETEQHKPEQNSVISHGSLLRDKPLTNVTIR
jgi:hypothetical protein